MVVENNKDENNDEFPIGMRVLAVDDDPTCLKLLETLLKKCQYHVTSTNQAVTALKMLRENKNKFDLVISDVLMPDMDGFKLLELVGLEMDLPVIMLSANGDTKMVMKGISHGACDYLLKPVRLEELKNIWQHVIRKKIDSRDSNNSNSLGRIGSDGNGSRSANSDHDAKLSRKRKEQNEDDDEDQDENDDNEDPSSQKKPRVVWSVDLHYKFVAAVNQLGLDKAVPKKILEIMNDDKLTRENVASHLQKYRMYLKKISSMANQQPNMLTALGPLGGPDYLRMNSVNFFGFNGGPQFPSNSLGSIPPSGAIGRLNTPAGFGLPWFPPSGLVPSGQSQIPTSSFTDTTKFHPNSLPNHTGVVVQGMPASLKFDEIQKNDAVLNGSSNSILNLPNSSLTMQGRSSQDRQSFQNFGVASNSTPNLLDHNRCNGNWPAAVLSQPNHMNPLENFPMQNPNVVRDNMLQNMIYPSRPVWNPNFPNNPINSLTGSTQNAYAPSNPSENLHRNMGLTSMAQPKFDSLCPPYDKIQQNNSGVDMAMKMKQGQFTEQGGRPLGNFNASNGADSLEDVVTAMLKHEVDGMTNDNED